MIVPLKRKLYRKKDGTYRISLPKSWVEGIEKDVDKKMIGVSLIINKKIVMFPMFEEDI